MQRSARYSEGLKPRTMKDRESAGFSTKFAFRSVELISKTRH